MGAVVTVALRCTVRGCTGALVWDETQLRCPLGHAFDRGREGYWNLLQPQDRRSLKSGDSDYAVLARRRWLARGFADGLAVAAGDSGHGFKFAPVLGDLIADAIEDKPSRFTARFAWRMLAARKAESARWGLS